MGGPDDDVDLDGFTPNQGDCNDCDDALSPNNVEVAGTGFDENCDGAVDEPFEPCDELLVLDDDDPVAAAAALELCKASPGPGLWGVVSGAWMQADGTPLPQQAQAFHLGHGILEDFGDVIVPRAGARLLALSNAVARDANDPDYSDPESNGGKGYSCGFPPGSPKPSAGCAGVTPGLPQDSIALELVVRVPGNANGFAFDSSFFSTDWPNYVCSTYDDTFFALLSPTPMGQADGQIAFYADGSPVSLNGAPFDVCSCMAPPCTAGGKTYACAQGDAPLAGTGFEGHASTGWQTTTAPAAPGSEITLRLGAYDGADGILGATALVDSFRWITTPGAVVSTTASP